MSCVQVENFKEFLIEMLGVKNKTSTVTTSELSQQGDHYCSNVIKVDITTEKPDENQEKPTELNVVVKVFKEGLNENLLDVAKMMFGKEIAFYTEIMPCLRDFQLEQGFHNLREISPKMLAYRRNLNGFDGELDENVLIVLENLKYKGYFNIDRLIGFDLEGAKLVLKDLAAFHAIPLALKLKQPDVFETKIKKHCKPLKFPDDIQLKHISSQKWIDAIMNQEKCKPYQDILKRKLDIELERMDSFFVRPAKEPYATLIHMDMWTNNTMQIIQNGKLIKNKFIDFQNYNYGNFLFDLIFFIWSSVQSLVIDDHYEELVRYYHYHFVKILNGLGCDTSLFEYKYFMEQINEDAPYELVHILYMAIVIYVDKGEKVIDFGREVDDFMSDESIGKATAERIEYVIAQFGKRGWIQL